MGTQNSQKKSPRGSTTSKRETSSMPELSGQALADADKKEHMDYSTDHVTRVRAAKEAAIRQMEAFGDPSEYDVSIIHGQRKEEPIAAAKQVPLEFQDDPGDPRDGDN